MSTKVKAAKRKCVSKKTEAEKTVHKQDELCSLCGKPATRLVDGEPSCEEHIEQVYEHQVADEGPSWGSHGHPAAHPAIIHIAG